MRISAGQGASGAVRVATEHDGDVLRRLIEEFVSELMSRRGASLLVEPGLAGAAGLTGGRTLVDALADPGQQVLVAVPGGTPVGFAVCRLAQGEQGASRGVLGACYVEPDSRGAGIGRALVDHAIEWCAEHGCDGVDGVAFPGDRPAKNFFETSGFKARMLVMHRGLG